MEQPSSTPATVPEGMNSGEEAAALAFARSLAPQETTSPDEPESDLALPPTDEAEPVATEEEPAADADPEDEPAPEDDPRYLVKVDGKDTEVSLSELVAGYSRQADYTKKTMAVSAERKAAEQATREAQDQAKAFAEQLAEYGKRVEELKTALKDTSGEPDWETLQEQDPVQFAAEWAKWQVKAQRRQAVEAESQRVKQEQTKLQQEADHRHLAQEQEHLLTAVPEWKDAAKAKAELTDMVEYGKSLGFTAEELGNVTNHKLILLLRDGARYRSLATKVKQIPVPTSKQAKVVPTVAIPTAKPKVSELTRQRQRLAKTGEATDAAPIFEALIKAERAQKAR